MSNLTLITTAARRMAKEANQWSSYYRLVFDKDGNMLDGFEDGMWYTGKAPENAWVTLRGGKDNHVTYMAAQEALDSKAAGEPNGL